MIKDKKYVMAGVEIGEHGFHFETLLEEINERLIKKGCTVTNLNTSRVKWRECEHFDTFVEACKLLADNKIYFTICRHAQMAPEGYSLRLESLHVEELVGQVLRLRKAHRR